MEYKVPKFLFSIATVFFLLYTPFGYSVAIYPLARAAVPIVITTPVSFNHPISSQNYNQSFPLLTKLTGKDFPMKLNPVQCDIFKGLKTCCPKEILRPTCSLQRQRLDRCGMSANNCCEGGNEEAFGENNGEDIGGTGQDITGQDIVSDFDTNGIGFSTETSTGGNGSISNIVDVIGGPGTTTRGRVGPSIGFTNNTITPTTTTPTTTGTTVGVPEPGTITILAGMMSICAYLKRRYNMKK